MRAAALEIQFAKGTVHMGGVTFVRVSFCLFPLCQNTPPSNQEEPGKTLPSVKLDNPNLPGFGTVPVRRRFSHTATHFRPLRWPLTALLLPLATRHYSEPLLFVPFGVNPAALRTVRL